MVSFLSRRKDTLTVSFLEDVLYLHPPAKCSPQTPEELAALEPSHDPILRGQVTLNCAAARKARRISVELVGRATRHSGDGSHSYESSVSLEKHLEIDLHNERLEQGVHTCVAPCRCLALTATRSPERPPPQMGLLLHHSKLYSGWRAVYIRDRATHRCVRPDTTYTSSASTALRLRTRCRARTDMPSLT